MVPYRVIYDDNYMAMVLYTLSGAPVPYSILSEDDNKQTILIVVTGDLMELLEYEPW